LTDSLLFEILCFEWHSLHYFLMFIFDRFFFLNSCFRILSFSSLIKELINYTNFFSLPITCIFNLCMAQVRRQMHNPSSPPRQIPSLLDSIRLPPPSSTKNSRRTKSFQINNLSRYAGSTRRTAHTPLSYQTGLPFRSINTKYDLLIMKMMNIHILSVHYSIE
jgi:hypothetical protein